MQQIGTKWMVETGILFRYMVLNIQFVDPTDW